MKRLLLLVLMFPSLAIAQTKERHSRAYIGAILHDFDQPGISLVNSFGINQYLGIGAGADLTRFKGETMVPLYGDIRIKYPVNAFAPFAFGQFGYQLYNGKTRLGQDVTAVPMDSKMKGKYFYGGGLGVSYKANKVGFFLSYTQRAYSFKYDKFDINGRDVTPDNPKSAGILTLGLIF
jgi:hypothetical protein